MPTESGWTESLPCLLQDMRLWLRGGGGTVQMILLFKWSKLVGNRVKGYVEVFTARNENLTQTEIIFPTLTPAAAAAAQQITVFRTQLFGSMVSAGRDPNDTFNLSLDLLRSWAIDLMRREGFGPA